jgi:CBS domain-containing protein
MKILKLARVPAVTVSPTDSVLEAVERMKEERVGIVFVIDGSGLCGALSERDVMFRVVLRHRNPSTTLVGKTMTAPAISLPVSSTVSEAIHLMKTHRVRRLPVVTQTSVEGMVSLRHMLRERAVELGSELDSVLAYCLADGIGG